MSGILTKKSYRQFLVVGAYVIFLAHSSAGIARQIPNEITLPITGEFKDLLSKKTKILFSEIKGGGLASNLSYEPLKLPPQLAINEKITTTQAAQLLKYPLYSYTAPQEKNNLTNCDDWFSETSFGPNSIPDRGQRVASVVSHKCQALKIISEASAVKQSFIPHKGIAALDLIPETWRSEFVNAEPYHDPAEFDKQSPKLISPHKVLIETYYVVPGEKHSAEAEPEKLTFIEYAKGDFDDDSIEDMLLLASYRSSGTLAYSWLMVVTRYDDRGPYVNISKNIPVLSTNDKL